ELSTLTVPRSAAGPDLREWVLGSEGTLGVIVEATVRVRPRPGLHAVHGMLFRDFSAGVRAIRAWQESGLSMSMMRLSDAQETALSLLMRKDPTRRFDVTARFMDAVQKLGYRESRALMLFGME